MDSGGGGMGQGTSLNSWTPGHDGVRITVIDAESGSTASTPMDFSNLAPSGNVLYFGSVNKLQYQNGASLQLQSGGDYSCIKPVNAMPAIVSSTGRNNIESIRRYFCSEYACMMVADASGIDYESMVSGKYKLLVEPLAYFTHNGQYYCMTATEAALYDQLSGGALRTTMPSLTHKNLSLSMFLEDSDLGIPAWAGDTTGRQSNTDIINSLGAGIIWFNNAPPPPEEGFEAPDAEYRVDTDVITTVTLHTDADLTPSNPAAVTFSILGTDYKVENIVIPKDDSQVVWVKWHTPATPQSVTISVSVTRAATAQDSLTVNIVDLNEKLPPDPYATDTYPGYTVPSLPSNSQKLAASWSVWSCKWVANWKWHADWKWEPEECGSSCPAECPGGHGDWEDKGEWVDEGKWVYESTDYSASITGTMTLMPDDIVLTASGKDMKSGYGVKTEVCAKLATEAPDGHVTNPQTAFTVFPEFQYRTYLRLLQRTSGGRNAKFAFRSNEFSTYGRSVHFTPIWFPDSTHYIVQSQVWDAWTPAGMLSLSLDDYVAIQGSMYDDWYTNRE